MSSKSKLILFCDNRSPPVRACLMLINILKVDVEKKFIDLFKGEQLEEDFTKINPIHTVPTLVVNDNLILTDSHAILLYLASEYETQSCEIDISLDYSMEIVNKLFFNASVFFRRDSDLMSDIVRKGYENVDFAYHQRKIHECYNIMEAYLTSNKYMAESKMTIADLAILATLSTVNIAFPIGREPNKWPLLNDWFNRMQYLPGYDEYNSSGLNKLKETMETIGNFKFPIEIDD